MIFGQSYSDTPILVGWKQHEGNIYGRLYSKDWKESMSIVTPLADDDADSLFNNKNNGNPNQLKPNAFIVTKSGHTFFLSDEELELRTNAKLIKGQKQISCYNLRGCQNNVAVV